MSRHVTSPLLVPLRATAPSCALSANGAKPYPVYFSRTSRSSGQRQGTIKHEGQCQGCSKCSKQQWGQCSGGVSHHRDAAKPSPHCRLHGSFPSGNGTTIGRCEGPDWALLRPRRGATLLSAHPSGLRVWATPAAHTTPETPACPTGRVRPGLCGSTQSDCIGNGGRNHLVTLQTAGPAEH